MRASKEVIRIPGGHSFRVLRWSQSVEDVECMMSPAQSVPLRGEGSHWHFHQEMELTLFTSGVGTRFVGDHISSFSAGDLVLLGEKLPHYWHTSGTSSGVSVQWYFPRTHAFWEFPETPRLQAVFQQAERGLHLSGETAGILIGLMQELTVTQGLTQLGSFLRLLGQLDNIHPGERQFLSARSFSLQSDSHHKQAIALVVQHLASHYRDPVKLEEVLELAYMSRPTFARQFKQHSGRTFSGFLNHLRLQAACQELEQSDEGVLQVALGCGFSQISFFNRCFRRVHQCSPTEYRIKSRKSIFSKGT